MCIRVVTLSFFLGKRYFAISRDSGKQLAVAAAVFFTAASLHAGMSSAEFVASAPRVAVVSAVNPCLSGTHMGVFLGYNWQMAGPFFDFNESIIGAVRGGVKREIKVMDGHAAGLVVNSLQLPRLKFWEDYYRLKLSELAAAWEVDAILVIHGTDTADWMGRTGMRIAGLGLFEGGRKRESYAVLALSIYDARGNRFRDAEVTRKGRELPPVNWRKTWEEYTPHEQTILVQCVQGAVEDGVASLLGRVGLAPAVDEKRNFNPLFSGDPGKSWVPDGNQIKLPAGVSRDVTSAAVLSAFRTRGWQISSSGPGRIVGIITHGKKEAVETAIIEGDMIALTAEHFEIQSNGQRVPIAPHDRWHQNLKESIVTELFNIAPEAHSVR